ncbi:GtrA family protein [Micrococcoides hystricis]|uniref:GtrA family protein n=1 Tax=Micrococcoides hystricis TaxID=1572761 RepID=A0ABV6PB19_9MICC
MRYRFVSFASRIRALVKLLWREVAKFGTVGGLAFIIDSGIYVWLLSGPMSDSAAKAKVVAGIIATIFSWVANRYWTFRDRRQANPVKEAVLFGIMNVIGIGIQVGCVLVAKYLLDINSVTGLFIAGNVVGLILGTIFRFFAYRFWVFSGDAAGGAKAARQAPHEDPAALAAAIEEAAEDRHARQRAEKGAQDPTEPTR